MDLETEINKFSKQLMTLYEKIIQDVILQVICWYTRKSKKQLQIYLQILFLK